MKAWGLGVPDHLREDRTQLAPEEKVREAGVPGPDSHFTHKPKRRWAWGQSQDLALPDTRED